MGVSVHPRSPEKIIEKFFTAEGPAFLGMVASPGEPICEGFFHGYLESYKTRAQDMAGIAHLESDPPLKAKRFMKFKAPRQFIDKTFHPVDFFIVPV